MINTVRKYIVTPLALVALAIGICSFAPVQSVRAASNDCGAGSSVSFAGTFGTRSFAPGALDLKCLAFGNSVHTVFQTDGNLVTYKDGRPYWTSSTSNRGATRLALQSDGNVVIYRGSAPIWTTHTAGQAGRLGNVLRQLPNGQLNLYRYDSGSNPPVKIW